MITISEQNLLVLAREVVSQEAKTLMDLAENIDLSLVRSAELILESEGRVIVTGVGKSALIAQKMVATLNSTGTPSFFMHAADAIHGDLGMLRPEDVVICLSKSGQTSEIKVLIPLLKARSNAIIAIVAQKSSYLAEMADVVLYTPVSREADPNNLAPTASTMAQLAVGDALSMVLAHLRGFKPEDFAHLHPGGSLGKQLHLTVGDLSKRHIKPVVKMMDSVRAVIVEISSKRLGATAVLDAAGLLAGIITDGDLRRMMEQTDDFSNLTASDIKSSDPKQVSADTLAKDALIQMRDHNITQLLVMNESGYQGVVHIHDILKEGIS